MELNTTKLEQIILDLQTRGFQLPQNIQHNPRSEKLGHSPWYLQGEVKANMIPWSTAYDLIAQEIARQITQAGFITRLNLNLTSTTIQNYRENIGYGNTTQALRKLWEETKPPLKA